MRLFLLRHAHTEKAKGNTTDFDRQIDLKGQRQLDKMKIYLKENYSDVPFHVFCSPAKRTKTTYETIKSSINVVEEEYAHELYLPSRQNLLRYLWTVEQHSEDVMIVAHNNGISELASYLLDQSTLIPTCGLVVIEFQEVEDLNGISKGLGIETDCFLPD